MTEFEINEGIEAAKRNALNAFKAGRITKDQHDALVKRAYKWATDARYGRYNTRD